MRELSNRALRQELGIPRTRFATLAGVNRTTVTLYEANPDEVGCEKRDALERTYDALREAARKSPGGTKLLKAG